MNDTKAETPNGTDERKGAGPGGGASTAPEAPTPANDAAGTAAPDAADATASAAEAKIASLEAELAAKSAELAAFKDSAQRQLAEVLNLRRRAENDSAEAKKYGAAPFAREILGVADNLKRALAAAGDTQADDAAARAQKFEGLRQGVELIDREFSAILERHSIKRIDPQGEKFDHNFHQAMFEVETPDAEPGTVVQVVQAGYRLHDRLLRPAMVGVAKAPSPKPEGPTPEEPPPAAA